MVIRLISLSTGTRELGISLFLRRAWELVEEAGEWVRHLAEWVWSCHDSSILVMCVGYGLERMKINVSAGTPGLVNDCFALGFPSNWIGSELFLHAWFLGVDSATSALMRFSNGSQWSG